MVFFCEADDKLRRSFGYIKFIECFGKQLRVTEYKKKMLKLLTRTVYQTYPKFTNRRTGSIA